MGVSAVPGSGKTATLVALAAGIVREGGLAPGQEVLVVTLVNSAVNNFAARLTQELQDSSDLLPGLVGFRVRTLHGLANDIVKERPGLAGLAEDFRVIEDREAGDILQEAVDGWLRGNPYAAKDWLGESHFCKIAGCCSRTGRSCCATSRGVTSARRKTRNWTPMSCMP